MPKAHRLPYGKAVMPEEDVEAARKARKEKTDIYGPAVTGKRGNAPPKVSKGNVSPDDASLTLKNLEKLLDESPEVLDQQIDAEFLRPDGARKGALQLFIQTEQQREGGPRADILQILERALTEPQKDGD